MAGSYKGGLDPWKQLYAEFFQARGLQPRPGITVGDIAGILSACSEAWHCARLAIPVLR